MFVIGEANTKVHLSKLDLPNQYQIKKKKIYGIWIGNNSLYLSDEIKVLKGKAGKDGIVFEPIIDSKGRIKLPEHVQGKEAHIKGHISWIQIEFKDEEEKQ